jgi:anti-sigma-K factor RskA
VTGSLHALSGAYAVDALDDAERAAFERHLAQCPDCQQEVASLREATALMADDAVMTPPPGLRDSVLAGIKNIRPIPPQTDSQTDSAPEAEAGAEDDADLAPVLPMHRRRRRIAGLVAVAAAILAVAGGVVLQPWQDDSSQAPQMSAADRVLAAEDVKHVAIEFDDNSKATVFHSPKQGRAVLVTDDMAAPPRGKTFELWLQDESGAMVPAGLMDSPGNNKVLLKGDAAKATGVGITVEPEGGSKEPTTKPIALFEFDEAKA